MPRTRGGILDPFDGLEAGSGGRKAGRGSRGRGHLEWDEASLEESALDYSRDDFEINEMVLARNAERNDSWWPVKFLSAQSQTKTQKDLWSPEEESDGLCMHQ